MSSREEGMDIIRGERSIKTIASLDQWPMTIENHWNQLLNDTKTIKQKTIEANGLGAENHLMVMVEWPQNHWKTIELNGESVKKQLMVMVKG